MARSAAAASSRSWASTASPRGRQSPAPGRPGRVPRRQTVPRAGRPRPARTDGGFQAGGLVGREQHRAGCGCRLEAGGGEGLVQLGAGSPRSGPGLFEAAGSGICAFEQCCRSADRVQSRPEARVPGTQPRQGGLEFVSLPPDRAEGGFGLGDPGGGRHLALFRGRNLCLQLAAPRRLAASSSAAWVASAARSFARAASLRATSGAVSPPCAARTARFCCASPSSRSSAASTASAASAASCAVFSRRRWPGRRPRQEPEPVLGAAADRTRFIREQLGREFRGGIDEPLFRRSSQRCRRS